MNNSFLLQDSFLEKIELLKKIKALWRKKELSLYEVHYVFDCLIGNWYYNRKEQDIVKDEMCKILVLFDSFDDFDNKDKFDILLWDIITDFENLYYRLNMSENPIL